MINHVLKMIKKTHYKKFFSSISKKLPDSAKKEEFAIKVKGLQNQMKEIVFLFEEIKGKGVDSTSKKIFNKYPFVISKDNQSYIKVLELEIKNEKENLKTLVQINKLLQESD